MNGIAGVALMQDVLDLSRKAGEVILEVYAEGNLTPTLKSGGSPVTRADTLANGLIVEGLHTLTPDLPVLSEECEAVPYRDRQRWGTYWLVDPLDGTKEFLNRNGEFTVNIALIEEGRGALGVVHAPALNLTYYAIRGEAAFRIRGSDGPVRISTATYSSGPLRIVTTRSHADESLNDFLQSLGNHDRLPVGSSMKFCLVADSSAHLYPRLGPTMEWDTAAGQCIVEAAGGTVTDLQGHPIRYNKPSLLNPGFVASGRFVSRSVQPSGTSQHGDQDRH